MKRWFPSAHDRLAVRLFWLYGLFMFTSNFAFLLGYYLLPEGILRLGPQTATARVVANAGSFVGELTLTLLFNVGAVIVIAVIMNLNSVRSFPVGYVYPFFMGIVSGLIPGTNSFVSSDLADYSVRDGLALSLSIGNLEMLGYICVIAATAGIALYEYKSWWRWQGEWKAVKTKSLRDARLSRAEWTMAVIGVALVVVAAVRETMMSYGLL